MAWAHDMSKGAMARIPSDTAMAGAARMLVFRASPIAAKGLLG
jgi:hypothetical protein